MHFNLLQALDRLFHEDLTAIQERQAHRFDQEVEPFQKAVVLFGAGNLGKRVLQCLRNDGIEPLAFTDNNALLWGSQIDGLAVISPETAVRAYRDKAAFIVSIFSPGNYFTQVRHQLISLGCNRVVPFVFLAWKYPILRPLYCIDLPEFSFYQQSEVRAAGDLWEDDASKREYFAQLKFRLRGSYTGLTEATTGPQYFPDDLILLSDEEEFVDCGAFDGDTITEFVHQSRGRFKHLHALEPDPNNYTSLIKKCETFSPEISQRISCHQVAAGNRHRYAQFNETGSPGSAISTAGTSRVAVVPLDSLLSSSCPTFIKMDIEGAEIDALLGAQQVIARDQPTLAICVYHKPDDLWKIPLLIKRKFPQYRLFLRSHSSLFDVVCYALPGDKRV